MKRSFGVYPEWGIFIVRIMMGLVFAVHGYQKFAGGLGNAAAFFAKISIPAPGPMALFIAVLELGGGVLLLIGLATRWVGLLFALEMAVTTLWVQLPARGWDGSELDRMLFAGGLLLFLGGSGRLAALPFLESSETPPKPSA